MASNLKNLSVFDRPVPSAAEMSFGIVVAEWNHAITSALLDGAIATLRAAGCPEEKISVKWVPGTFELAMGAQYFAEYTNVDAVIVLGCVIQGDTRHFDFVCQGPALRFCVPGGDPGRAADAVELEHAHCVRRTDYE